MRFPFDGILLSCWLDCSMRAGYLQLQRLSFDRGNDKIGTKLWGTFDMIFKEKDAKVWEGP